MVMNKLGAMPPKKDFRDYKFKPAAAVNAAEIPESYEVFWTPPVKNQGCVNSCVAHVSAEIEEYFNYAQCNTHIPLSPGYIYGCRYNYKGEGMYLRDALKTLKKRGIATKEEFDYNCEVPEMIEIFNKKDKEEGFETDLDNTINSYISVEGTNNIKQALMKYGPIMTSVKWYDNFYADGEKLKGWNVGDYGYHCVMIYGWNEKGWLIQNSWGTGWGDNGKFIYPFDYEIAEAWAISDNVDEEVKIVNPNYNKIIDFLYKIANYIANHIFKKS